MNGIPGYEVVYQLLMLQRYPKNLAEFLLSFFSSYSINPFCAVVAVIHGRDIFVKWFKNIPDDGKPNEILTVTIFDNRVVNITYADTEGQIKENVFLDIFEGPIEKIVQPIKTEHFDLAGFYRISKSR